MTDDDRPKKYRKTPPFGSRELAAPHEVVPETTGVHTRIRRISDELKSQGSRLSNVERDVSQVKVITASMDGKLDGVAIAIDAFQTAVQTTNTHIRADIEVTKARAITETEDKGDARKTRRRLLLKIASAFGGTGIIATITALIAKGC